MASEGRTLAIYDLGLVEYEDGLNLQKAFATARKGSSVPDVLMLLEHPPVLTMGRGGKAVNILAPAAELDRLGVRLHETDRGGDVTYHGPGQVVGYPVVNLAPDRCDVRRYVRDIEEMMIATVGDYGLKADRIDGWTGVWLGEKGKDARKIGAVGVHISRWITTHGFALNVNTNLSHFGLIVPCGIAEAGVTSLEKELGGKQPLPDVKKLLAQHLAERLGAQLITTQPTRRMVSVTILREREGLEALVLKRHTYRGGFWQQVTGTRELNESAPDCAVREVREEAGYDAVVEPLDYVHSFAFGAPRADRAPAIFEETAFFTVVPGVEPVRLDRSEHDQFVWLPLAQAIERVPFVGLKEGLRRAGKVVLARKAGAA